MSFAAQVTALATRIATEINGRQKTSEKGAASGYMGLDGSSRGAQDPKLHRATHLPGGSDALASQGTTTGLAALDPATLPTGYKFTVTNDPSFVFAIYEVVAGAWVMVAALPASGREIGRLEVSGNYDCNSNTVALNVGGQLTITAPGVDYCLDVFIPVLGSAAANTRGWALLADADTSTQILSLTACPTSTTLVNGPSVRGLSKKITGVAAGTTKNYQLVSIRSPENTTGANRVGSLTMPGTQVCPIVVRAVIA